MTICFVVVNYVGNTNTVFSLCVLNLCADKVSNIYEILLFASTCVQL